jgi:ABC-type transporter Mla MlaB component
MPISAVYQHDRCIVRIDGPFTIYEATDSKYRLLDELNIAPEIDVDLSGVAELDTAGLQLLLLFKREAMKLDKQVRFHGHSKAVLSVIDLFNLGGVFGDPVVLSGEGGR